MSSRQYIKRVWRVPKTDPVAYLSALVVKALVKHGWPARAAPLLYTPGFQIRHVDTGLDAEPDFWAAVSIAVRIAARTYRVDVEESEGMVQFLRSYTVTPGGHFKEQRS